MREVAIVTRYSARMNDYDWNDNLTGKIKSEQVNYNIILALLLNSFYSDKNHLVLAKVYVEYHRKFLPG